MRRFADVFLTSRCFLALGVLVVQFLMGYVWPVALVPAQLAVATLLGLVLADGVVLFRVAEPMKGHREVPERLSNGDVNPIALELTNAYPFNVRVQVIDEAPVQLQLRKLGWAVRISAGATQRIRYTVRPTTRGVYAFGHMQALVRSPLGLVERRLRLGEPTDVPVYPAYLQMRQYELLAISNRLTEAGVKRIRRLGHTMEFDHIRDYVVGDDVRTVNWKATARRGGLMVNQYVDERAQPVYCLIDMGRMMELPFDGLTLLDHSINASLVLSNVALMKQDRAGLVAFSHTIARTVPASRRPRHMVTIQEALYNLKTDFKETDMTQVAVHVRRHLRQRSLLVLFTNFETRTSMRRQLPGLRALAAHHVLVVVFFENTELHALQHERPKTTEGVFVKAVGEQFTWEKRAIVAELQQHGIQAVLTAPSDLTANTINHYLQLKARGLV